jgi:PAS domain S-box-containing protein
MLDVTEQKRAEDELRQSVARERTRATELKALMDAVPGAIFISHDRDCHYIYGNRATYQLLRREPGSNLSRSAPADEMPTHFQVLQNGVEIPAHELPVQKAAFTGQTVKDCELNLIFEDGLSVTWFGGAAPILDEGRPRGAVGVFVDITERKRAEQALQDSEERLRLAQEAAGVGYFDWNLVTGEMTWSESLKRMLGLPSSTQGLWEKLRRIHPEDRPAFEAQVQSALDGQSPKVSITYRSTTPARTPCWCLCEARVHRDENGKPVRMLGVIADITAHKQAEQAQQIEQERKHLEAGIRTLTDGVLLADVSGRLLSMNPAAMRIFGFDSYEHAPRDLLEFTELFEVTNLDGSPVRVNEWPVARALRGEITNAFECRTRNRKTGRAWIASYGCAPVLDETGAIIMVVLGIHDTTTERAATEEVQRANAMLHALSGQLLRLQDEERKRIARELHDGTLQMITAISMNLLMIGRSPNVLGSNETLGLIVEAQELAKRCSRELRTVSYLLHPPDLEELGLVAALRSWVDGFAHRTGIVMDVNLDDPGRLDPDVETAFFRIAQEALSNVQRHSGSSRAGVNLIVSEQEIRLDVHDEGNGVPREIVDRTPERLGVGILGMRERARQLGGTLEIISQTSGTTARAILPRRSV